jgi:small subunit ribosomal protein S17
MKIFKGKVISTKMAKTATVAVERMVVHPIYKKRYRRVRKYHVHDETGTKVGDIVKFAAAKPESKLKKWKIIEVVGIKKEERKGAKSSSK